MSALVIDDYAATPSLARPAVSWRPVTRRAAWAKLSAEVPGSRPVGEAAALPREVISRGAAARPVVPPRAHAGQVRLTDRGIAVVVFGFLAVCLVAAFVLVAGFLAISDAAPDAALDAAPGAAAVGAQW